MCRWVRGGGEEEGDEGDVRNITSKTLEGRSVTLP